MNNFMKLFIKKIMKKYRPLSKKYRENPVEPWAFIRVFNEITTIEECLNSIKPVIKKGVIGYHELPGGGSDDGTIEYITKFCKENKGFILYKYPYQVIPASDERYKNLENVKIENRIGSYYNEVMKNIPNGEWVIKIDGDHVFDTEKLSKLMYLPKKDTDMIIFSRMNLHYKGDKLFYIKDNLICEPGDSWLFKKNNTWFDTITYYDKKGMFCAYEHIHYNQKYNRYYTDLFNWHFPYQKSYRNIVDNNLVPFSFLDKNVIVKYKLCYHIPDDMIDEERIIKYCKRFNKVK